MSEELFKNSIIKELIEKTRVIWALDITDSLIGWDIEVLMPREGSTERGMARAELQAIGQKILKSPEIKSLVDEAERHLVELNDYERGLLRVLKRRIKFATSIPENVLKEYFKTVSEATVQWRIARSKSDYKLFKPYLGKIVDLMKKIADYLGYEEHPYDALLDLYEEGFRCRDADRIFSVLEPGIRRIFNIIQREGIYKPTHKLEEVEYNVEDMKNLNLELLKILEYPIGVRARFDVSTHPFTTSIGIKDVRITTRYEGKDFKRSMYSTMHEYGHALYELQIDEKLSGSILATGVSGGIHESQSRFWENIIGRGREFTEAIYPLIKRYLKFVEEYTPEELYYYFNTVKASLIRVDADEVTYNLHILLRYKLEKAMITEEVKIDELPEIWNSEFERLLGIRPKEDREGVLQDIHWSMGLGSFCNYTIGNVVAAQILKHMEKNVNLKENILKLNFKPIREYLKVKVHVWGSVYEPKELLKRSFGEEMKPEYLIQYLEEKYLN
ncbi:MAG: carboxypeptidase M32 [Candidatus Methanomethylicia archaeon]|nr:carboxypeptidase M32 [Candidatus Methanomethylicia archaeon]